MRYQGTDIDGPQTGPDKLLLRGNDLVDLIGEKSLLESLFLALYDKFPSEKQMNALNRFFDDAFNSIDSDDAIFKIIPQIATNPAYSLNALIACLAVDREGEISSLVPPDLEEIEITESALAGFYFMAILPIFCGFSAAFPIEKDTSILKRRLADAKELDGDYIDRIAILFKGNPFANAGERRLVESVLVSFSAGFGFMTPSIMTPRISIGSGVSVGIAMIASCTTAGPWHLGTSQDVIMMFQEMNRKRAGRPVGEFVNTFLDEKFDGGKKLLGFGHPFFKIDPRVTRLLEIVKEEGLEHEAIDLFKKVSGKVAVMKKIHPNLEAIHGAIMTSIGFSIPFLGPSIALIGRSVTMIAHMEERQTKPAFGVKNSVARNYFDKVPMGWL